ncbi:Ca2+-dependent phosphoinositide-specific phospholipase C [Haloferula sp. BvORR071]|uniref:Ca2+-dependent phosphoinositide-specific phospholipase C n=1 Tax=Haloferula sp. BvORR071 TaxID=1396141 RepID=UPI000552D4A7|nr:Ca2+-dependent phosphoinositide-specific phospholipase C [Haloferula sp. BvORR071]
MRLTPALLFLALALPAAADELKLNQIQAIGSHNSYHMAPPPALMKAIVKFNKEAEAWNYTHPPLATQLDMGVRQFELDIFADTKGGLFANPFVLKLAKLAGETPPAYDPNGELAKPGFKVQHVPDIDCWSTVPSLKLALEQMNAWSDQHPRHLPVMVLLECKDQPQTPLPVKPETLTRERLLELEQELLAAIPAKKILKPDDIRSDASTLREAVLKKGWPTVDDLRGKFLFCLDNTDEIRARYLEGNPSLEGRVIFVSAPEESDPAAAWFKCNDPEKEQEKIQKLVRAGYLVRTRSDTKGPDEKMREAAFKSGAQWVSTDLLQGDTKVSFEGAMARKNPISSKAGGKVEP